MLLLTDSSDVETWMRSLAAESPQRNCPDLLSQCIGLSRYREIVVVKVNPAKLPGWYVYFRALGDHIAESVKDSQLKAYWLVRMTRIRQHGVESLIPDQFSSSEPGQRGLTSHNEFTA